MTSEQTRDAEKRDRPRRIIKLGPPRVVLSWAEARTQLASLPERGLNIDLVHPIIHPPQVAIVGIGTIARRPWVVGDRVEVRRVVTLTLAADHRVTDGHGGARFLHRIAHHAAQPESE